MKQEREQLKNGKKINNCLTPKSDQDRISPYNQPDKEMKRKKEKYQQGKKIDPKPNSLNEHFKNCMAKSKENQQGDIG